MRLLTRDAANRIDESLIHTIGIPKDILIEHAGMAVAKWCIEVLKARKALDPYITVQVFTGRGMNGSDAVACAGILHAQGYRVNVWEVFPSKDKRGDWRFDAAKSLGLSVQDAKDYQPDGSGLVVDGIFGTAFAIDKPFPASLKNLFTKINTAHELGCLVVAIDLPSGVDTDTGAVSPYTIVVDETVTFIRPKVGIVSYPGRKYAGKIHIETIGIPSSWIETFTESYSLLKTNAPLLESSVGTADSSLPLLLDLDTAREYLAKRPDDGHKGTFGSLGIIGGSRGMAGSVCLSAMAAMRSGVGLTYMRVPKAIEADCLAIVPESLVSTDYKPVFEKSRAILIGPGMDKTRQSVQMLWNAMVSFPLLVLDAGALNILAQFEKETTRCLQERRQKNLPWLILTPHPGEFKRLAPDLALLDRVQAAKAAAERFGAIMVLKGAGTVIADPEGTVCINTSGNSSMAKGGSGDVLSGILTSILAQGVEPMQACAFAIFFHGLCGDLAAAEWGEYAAIPGDLIRKMPEAFRLLGEHESNCL